MVRAVCWAPRTHQREESRRLGDKASSASGPRFLSGAEAWLSSMDWLGHFQFKLRCSGVAPSVSLGSSLFSLPLSSSRDRIRAKGGFFIVVLSVTGRGREQVVPVPWFSSASGEPWCPERGVPLPSALLHTLSWERGHGAGEILGCSLGKALKCGALPVCPGV